MACKYFQPLFPCGSVVCMVNVDIVQMKLTVSMALISKCPQLLHGAINTNTINLAVKSQSTITGHETFRIILIVMIVMQFANQR